MVGALAAFVLGFAAMVALTRTGGGRQRVLEYTLEAVGGRLQGKLEVARLDGNLITGARLYGLELRGTDGELVVRADSAYANYELPSFFGGDAVLNRLVLYSSEVLLSRMPGDSLWNYQEILLDTSSTAGQGPPRATIINSARLVDAEVTVRVPWEPADYLSPAERAVAISEALADTSRLDVVAADSGYVRTMTFDITEAGISELVIAGDDRGGTYVRVDTAAFSALLYRGDPLVVRDLAGELSLNEGVLRYAAPTIQLPSSRIRSTGKIDLSGEAPAYDLTVAADSAVRLEDFTFIYPYLPEGGTAAFGLTLETHPEGTLYRVRDLRFDAPGTRMTGSFGVVMNGTLRFTDVDLTAEPLRVQTIEEMLPAGLPVTGLRIGSVEIRSDGDPAAAAGVSRG